MGREVRQVPPNWEHPKNENGHYKPMYERNYLTELNDWWENHQLWLKGEHPYQNDDNPSTEKFYAEYDGNPPDVEYYVTYSEDEATWFQLYETVSEGTPVSPPFETKEELAQYLAANGDFWYQKDVERDGYACYRTKPTIAQARSLVDTGFAMSFVAVSDDNGVKVMDAYEQQDIKAN